MTLLAIGINHNTAPVAFRERVSVTPEQLPEALHSLTQNPAVREAAILSTCNRTDIYCGLQGSEGIPANSDVQKWLAGFRGLENAEVAQHSYTLEKASAVRHVMRVGSGLDSMVLGEPQILGQLKVAYRAAVEQGTVGSVLSKLFQHTFAVAKKVRTDTQIGSSPVSVAYAAVSLARRIFGNLEQNTALLLGAGETVELAARHLTTHGLGRLIVANRTVENARRLAKDYGGYAIGLDELDRHLADADVVIASTGAPHAVLTAEMAERALANRRRQPMLMVDIAVPQDIEQAVGDLQDVFLYNIDDLQEIVAEGQRSREAAAQEAMEIIDAQVDDFMGWLEGRATSEYIRSLRADAEEHRDELLDKALKRLANGESPEKLLHFVANTLTNKLMHKPTAAIRQAASRGELQLVDYSRRIFGVGEPGDEP